jgi:Uma2 family endonuclease
MATAVELSRRRFTADEFEAMARTGILNEGDRIELIDGDIVAMTPIGLQHAATVARLNRAFVKLASDDVIVQPQGSLRLDMSTEPQPDLVLLRYRDDFYARDPRPMPEDVLLVVEVADSSLRYDTTVKATLYARTGYREYWVVDLNAEAVIRHTAPVGERYLDVGVIPANVPFAPLALSDCLLTQSDIFGARR